MHVSTHPSELPIRTRPVFAALGMFDGVHLGHQHVIRQALLDAHVSNGISVAITFDPHPLAVVNPLRAPALLQTLSQRLRAISDLGIEAALVIPFTVEFSQQTGEEFIRKLFKELVQLRGLSVGQGFHFGRGRSGNTPLLRSLGAEMGFRVHALAPIAIGGEIVSSTRIRMAIREGNFAHAAELLGRTYALEGVVVRGEGRGRTIGFPTANVDVRGLELPPRGVYAVRLRGKSASHPGAANLGMRPTVQTSTPQLNLEVHLLDFDGDLYDELVEIEFVKWLREERKFPSLSALRQQIARDVALARKTLRS
jgi:riboflavin kinase/FMN adenylyltransferase